MQVGNEAGFKECKLIGHLRQRLQQSSHGSSTGDPAEGFHGHTRHVKHLPLQISVKKTFKAFILQIAVQSVWNLIWSQWTLSTVLALEIFISQS